ncbi:MAG: hypothetical protein Q7T48_08565 [Cellvibrio sp.]|uniref:hypothetical protein n=1 Tax=Cellvibrio sp. TaxID=1965322 RepID=UPI002715C0A1|nr:hypothetical protein [Cellvibrio sp.]
MNNEDKTTPLEKLGYGLKYTLAIVIAILAICALCFIFINITTYFTPPLQPMFDQERLGQLGDFLGGTLNPIFGFATVCLLLWSVFIQRQELSLTREELRKSADALNRQVQLGTNEYNRKQLDTAIDRLYETLDRLYSIQSISPSEYTYKWNGNDQKNVITRLVDITSLSDELLEGALLHISYTRENIDKYQDINLEDTKTLSRMLATIEMILDHLSKLIEELMQITSIGPLKNYRFMEFQKEVEKLRKINVISNEKSIELLTIIKSSMQAND